MATTFEENEAIRKAEEDKLYGEDPESKDIESQRQALAIEEQQRVAELKKFDEEKPYDFLGIQADREGYNLPVPLLDGEGNYRYENGEIITYTINVDGTKRSFANRLSDSLTLPVSTPDAYWLVFTEPESQVLFVKDQAGDNKLVSISELIDLIKQQGPFKSKESNNSLVEFEGNADQRLQFDPATILTNLSIWKDAYETIYQ